MGQPDRPNFSAALKSAQIGLQQQLANAESTKLAEQERWRQKELDDKATEERQKAETRREFIEMGVVDAFEELIRTKTVFMQNYIYKGKQPIYGLFNRIKGYEDIEEKVFKPSRIDYGKDKICLVTKDETYGGGVDDCSGDTHYYEYIGVVKLEDDKFEIGYYPWQEAEGKRIKKKTVGKGEVIENLAKLITVYVYNRDIATMFPNRTLSRSDLAEFS